LRRRRSASWSSPAPGISANLADKAKKLGIPLWRFDKPAPTKNEVEGGAA
jgi:hypothetical protein